MIEWNQRLIAFVRGPNRIMAGSLLTASTGEWEDTDSFTVEFLDVEGNTWFGCHCACHEGLRSATATNLFEAGKKKGLRAHFVVLQAPVIDTGDGGWAVTRSSDDTLTNKREVWTLGEAFDRAAQAFNLRRKPSDGLVR